MVASRCFFGRLFFFELLSKFAMQCVSLGLLNLSVGPPGRRASRSSLSFSSIDGNFESSIFWVWCNDGFPLTGFLAFCDIMENVIVCIGESVGSHGSLADECSCVGFVCRIHSPTFNVFVLQCLTVEA